MTDRLYPDMFPFWLQVQAACDHAKNVTARLIRRRAADLRRDRADLRRPEGSASPNTLEFVNAADAAAFEGADDRIITCSPGGRERR